MKKPLLLSFFMSLSFLLFWNCKPEETSSSDEPPKRILTGELSYSSIEELIIGERSELVIDPKKLVVDEESGEDIFKYIDILGTYEVTPKLPEAVTIDRVKGTIKIDKPRY